MEMVYSQRFSSAEKFLSTIRIFFIAFVVFAAGFTGIALADVKTDIYSKLKCCLCKNSFEACSCPKAKEMKAYIEAFLDMGLSEEDILVKVAKKYSLDNINDKVTRDKITDKIIKEVGENRPEIFIVPRTYDFGKVSKSGKGNNSRLELLVKLQNKGSQPLVINNLKTSCACTTVRLRTADSVSPAFATKGAQEGWSVELAAGETAQLEIVTDLSHPHIKLGSMLRIVEISSNDPVYPQVRIETVAEIVE
jgi:hypothetical protein